MTTPQALHYHLLRPAIIHILRASGFASARPSVLDTLTDLAARHLQLTATLTADHVYDRTLASVDDDYYADLDGVLIAEHDLIPTISDVRLGLTAASFFSPTMTASEEAWEEMLRKPLDQYRIGAGEKERRRRDAEDTRDVKDFVDWAQGPVSREIRRVAGLLADKGPAADATSAPAAPVTAPAVTPTTGTGAPQAPSDPTIAEANVQEGLPEKQDYLSALKKKHGKHSDEARYAGTVLGKSPEEHRSHRIEGGPHSIAEWGRGLKRKHRELAT